MSTSFFLEAALNCGPAHPTTNEEDTFVETEHADPRHF